jgi:Ca2+-binding EF-hand superfamily protein
MTNFEIAFKMFDLDGNGTLEPEEFETIFTVLLKQSTFGMSAHLMPCGT